MAAGLREFSAGARRECSAHRAAARRVRRDHGRASSGAALRIVDQRIGMGAQVEFSPTSRTSGASPTRAFGRCAGRASISPTPRSWRGSRTIAPSRAPRRLDLRDRSRNGAHCAARFAMMSASTPSTRRWAASCRLRLGSTRRQSAHAAFRRFPAGFRSTHRANRCGDRARAFERWLRHAIQHGARARCPAARRRRIPCLQLLARGRLPSAGAFRRCRAAVSTPCRAKERCRSAERAVRSAGKASHRQFPQAFSHLALVNSAYNLTGERKPIEQRAQDEHAPPEEMTAGE